MIIMKQKTRGTPAHLIRLREDRLKLSSPEVTWETHSIQTGQVAILSELGAFGKHGRLGFLGEGEVCFLFCGTINAKISGPKIFILQ